MDTILTKNKSNILKFIAVILMILFHTFAFPERIKDYQYISIMTVNNIPIETYIGEIGKICVSIFVFLSGYGMYIKYKGKEKVYKSLFNKLFRFYINYWTVFIIFIPIGIIMHKYNFNIKEILLNFVGIKSTYNGEWWFVRLYVMLVLLYPLFTFIVNRLNVYIILLISFIINVLGFGITKISIILNDNYIILDLIGILLGAQFLFLLGMCIAKYAFFNKVTKKLNFKKSKYIILSFLILFLIFILRNVSVIGPTTELILVPMLCFFIANSVSNNNKISNLGKYSNNMWLTHSFFIYYLFPNIIFKFKYSILILLLVIFISMVCSFIINKIVRLELSIIKVKR
ncbi:acyltransferase family protein [Clostridium perfringens]|uniref:acyltransferase family protein n=1 Tax=Clostridium perfringens TaxID=1502 RepID=UPI0024BBF372|nr:acyltransferase [Clostridium perfringens]